MMRSIGKILGTLFAAVFIVAAAPAGAAPPASYDDFFPSEGRVKLLVILVETADLPHQLEPEVIRQRLFGRTDDGDVSLAEYFDDVSYGKLHLEGEVTPWIKLPRTMADYAHNSFGSQPRSYPHNLGGLAVDAVEAAAASGVDLAPYDNDGDGRVDGLMIIYSGPLSVDTRDANRLWPRSDYISMYGHDPIEESGKRIDSFSLCPEYIYTPDVNTVEVYCHELAHLMGLPDFSDKDQSSLGIGATDLLGYPPPKRALLAPSAYSRMALGWLDPIVVKAPGDFTLRPINHFPDALLLPTTRAREYFLLAYRQNQGVDQALAGSGLLLWHVNDRGLFENNRECPGPCADPPRLALVQADGLNDLEQNRKPFDPEDFFAALPSSPAAVGADTGRPGDPFQGATTLTFAGLPTGLRLGGMKIEDSEARVRVETNDGALPCRDEPCLRLLNARWEEVSGDGDGFAELGERVNLVLRVINEGAEAQGVYFSPEAKPLKWERSRTRVGSIGAGKTVEVRLGLSLQKPRQYPKWVKAIMRGFTDVPDENKPSLLSQLPAWFEPRVKVQISRPVMSVEFTPRLVLGTPELLVVDDAPHDLLPYLETGLDRYGRTWQGWDTGEQGLPSPALTAAAPAVLWMCGMNAWDGERYPGPDRAERFKAVVDGGHTLIVSASRVKDPPPLSLLALLGVSGLADAAGERALVRSPETPIQTPAAATLRYAYAPGYTPHLALTPAPPARAIFHDLRKHGAAVIRWTQVNPAGASAIKVRTLLAGFPLETLNDQSLSALLKAVLQPAPLARTARP